MSKDITDKDLSTFICRWLKSAFDIIASNFGDLVQNVAGLETWFIAEDGSFARSSVLPVYRFGKLEKMLFDDNPEWTALEKALNYNDAFKKHATGIVGTAYGSRRAYSKRDLCKLLLPIPEARANFGAYAETDIDPKSIVDDFIREINSASITTTTIWPIAGVRTQKPIVLDQNTQFRELTAKEKLLCLKFGMINGFEPDRIEQNNAKWFGLCLTEAENKTFVPIDVVPPDFMERFSFKEVLLEDFLAIIPLVVERTAFHAGGYSSAPSIEFGERLSFGTTGRAVPTSSFRFLHSDMDAELDSKQVLQLISIWKMVRGNASGKFKKRVVNAARRLFYSETRTKPEDALVDCIIAAESLYLDDDKNELTYRLSLNAALWIDDSEQRRKETFLLFKKAYGLRSKVVHGSSVNVVEITRIIDELKKVIRQGIRKALVRLETQTNVPDWNAMIFSNYLPMKA